MKHTLSAGLALILGLVGSDSGHAQPATTTWPRSGGCTERLAGASFSSDRCVRVSSGLR
jgi:hypothetical protein